MKNIIQRIKQLEDKVSFEADEDITLTLNAEDAVKDSDVVFRVKFDVVTDYAKQKIKQFRKGK